MLSSNPLVSVVIPAWNAGRYLRETLESAVKQTYSHLEIIVVNDGSTDDTAGIVADFTRRDPRVKLHTQERSGLAATRNRGISLSQGEWIAPLDADDLWYPDKIEKQLAAVKGPEQGRIGLVYGWTRLIDECGRNTAEQTPEAEGDVFLPLLLFNVVGHGSGPLIRRRCLDAVGVFDTDFYRENSQGCEDWHLYLRLARRYHFALVRDFLVGYRVSPEGMSRNYQTMARSFRLMEAKLRQSMPDLPRSALRWSKSDFYQRQIGKARAQRDFPQALRFLGLCCFYNPVRLLMPSTYWMLGQLLRGRVGPRAASDGARLAAPPRRAKRQRGGQFFDDCRRRMLAKAQLALSEASK